MTKEMEILVKKIDKRITDLKERREKLRHAKRPFAVSRTSGAIDELHTILNFSLIPEAIREAKS